MCASTSWRGSAGKAACKMPCFTMTATVSTTPGAISSLNSSAWIRSPDRSERCPFRSQQALSASSSIRPFRVTGMKPEVAQDPQVILRRPVMRAADKSYRARNDIVMAVERIEQCAIGIAVDGVDREVAPGGITHPVIGKHDPGPASVGFRIDPECRDFIHAGFAAVANDHGYRAVGNPGLVNAHAGSPGSLADVLRCQRGRNVDIGNRFTHQRIAHRATGNARFTAVFAQQAEQPLQRLCL